MTRQKPEKDTERWSERSARERGGKGGGGREGNEGRRVRVRNVHRGARREGPAMAEGEEEGGREEGGGGGGR